DALLDIGIAHFHDRALAELLLDLGERGLEGLRLVLVHPGGFRGGAGDDLEHLIIPLVGCGYGPEIRRRQAHGVSYRVRRASPAMTPKISMRPRGRMTGYALFAGFSTNSLRSFARYFTVNSLSTMAMTISPTFALGCTSTTRRSPSWMPASIIESPFTRTSAVLEGTFTSQSSSVMRSYPSEMAGLGRPAWTLESARRRSKKRPPGFNCRSGVQSR